MNCSLVAVRTIIGSPEVAGQPIVIEMSHGTHDLHGRINGTSLGAAVDFSMTSASDISIVGVARGASEPADRRLLQGLVGETVLYGPERDAIFFLSERSPRITLRNLVIRGQVKLEGGELIIDSCRFDGSRAETGGALDIRGGDVTVSSSQFVNNVALRGGAVHLDGGTATFVTCSFERNTAELSGGAMDVQRGLVRFRSRCSLLKNYARGALQSLWIQTGAAVVEYCLPAPLGFWVDSLGAKCAEFVEGEVAVLPYACAAGMKGGSDEMQHQSSSLCEGQCDEGFFCGPASVNQTLCTAGAFCPKGSSSPRPCKAGTYRGESGGTSQASCNRTEPGFFSPTQSQEQISCNAGSYTSLPEQGSCELCPAGRFQRDKGKSACDA